MNCKDCKFWDKRDTECNHIDWIEDNKSMKGNNFALFATASDDQGLTAKFKTGPLFGCVQFVKR